MTATVAVTFDNLGEASDLERGWWPEDEPLGSHHSVTKALPRLLEALDEAGLRATFFVEGLNTELYPETLVDLDARGHEVACHGWRHERWATLDAGAERDSLARSVERDARARAGAVRVPAAGRRADRGDAGAAARARLQLLLARGGRRRGRRAGAAVPLGAARRLPLPPPLRRPRRGQEAPLPPSALRETVFRALDEADGFLALLFHPFLADTEERLAVIRDALARVRELVDAGAVRCAPCRELL